MNKLNKKLEYALMSLQYLFEHPIATKVSAKDISDKTGSPFDATARVMQLMTHKGVLKSEQGVQGGYLLSKNLDQVSFLELVEVVSGPFELAKCLSSSDDCDIYSKCNIKSPINKVNHKLRNFFNEMSLTELLVDPQAVVEDVRL